ncbi:uncharacterized protein METZ01_LOCUS267573 [marine metagenome]|jgi:quinol monooxygenase YgiN|uniref:ABM domain-containing protein n=1 Tax=marine metagenome TaxID=408172 RepID=A0A382JSI5_9ZZZZ|tara:strand:+ start:834 stop:1133 length:300 start_codon:yes stop_codon:yes gene_type:complete
MTLVLFEIVVKSECVDQFKGLLEAELPNTRAYDGCQHVTPFLDEDGRTFVLVEHWDSKEHYEKYMEWRAAPGPGFASLGDLASLIEGDPSIRYFEALEA